MTTFTLAELFRRAEAQGVESVRVGPGNNVSILAKLGMGAVVGWEGTKPGSTATFTVYDGIDEQGRVLVSGTTPPNGSPVACFVFTQGLFIKNTNRFEAVSVFYI